MIDQPDLFVEPPDAPPPLSPFVPARKLGETFDPKLDGARLGSNQAKVLALMLDGAWHSTEELRKVGGLSGDRRARSLRDEACGGFAVEVRRDPGDLASGRWQYRLHPESTADQYHIAAEYLRAHRTDPESGEE